MGRFASEVGDDRALPVFPRDNLDRRAFAYCGSRTIRTHDEIRTESIAGAQLQARFGRRNFQRVELGFYVMNVGTRRRAFPDRALELRILDDPGKLRHAA